MLAFKIANDPHMGQLTFCRIYSGHVEAGAMLENTVKEKKERIGRMFQMHANSREQINEAYAGDIVAIVGLKDTTTGDTLSDLRTRSSLSAWSSRSRSSTSPWSPSPRPTRRRWASRCSSGRRGSELPRQDRRRIRPDHHLGHGRTAPRHHRRSHAREFKVEANIGAPQVAYREAITRKVEHDYTHKKQSGGSGQFARIKFVIEPNEAGKGFEFVSSRRRQRAEGIRPGVRRAWFGHGRRPDHRLPDRRREVHADGRRLPRRGLLGSRLRNRRPRGLP
jgi:elongation factor G